MPSAECIALNDKGVDSLENYQRNRKNGLDEAINLFKQSIDCDSTYLPAYRNLISAYDFKKSYDEEMVTYNKMLTLRKNDPIILMYKAMFLERTNQVDSAKQAYILSKKAYQEGLIKNPGNVGYIRGMLALEAVMDGKERAVKDLEQELKIHPELSDQLSSEQEFLKYFDRHTFVYGIP